MSLFDGTPDRKKEKRGSTQKTKNVHAGKYRSDDQALLDPRYGTGSRSAERTTAAHRTRNERRAITEAYERGEIKFDDTSDQFNLCRCNMFPDFHNYPHSPHTDELATFELQYHGRKK